MKKTAGLLLAFPLALGLTACSDNRSKGEKIQDAISDVIPAEDMPHGVELVKMGKEACEVFGEEGVPAMGDYLSAAYPGMLEAGGLSMLQAFADVLCPEYSDEVAAYLD